MAELPGDGRNTIAHLRDAVFFEGTSAPRKMSRFWILLVLSSIIAAAGVVADSTATVIGAMIVAPMLMPIQGIMLATVLGDQRRLAQSVLLVVLGASAAIGIGYVVGLGSINELVSATNSQVSARVHPKLIDLLAALATGIVGSIALVRKDISDTLPGVAIAISLVPPLSVVGVTLESGAYTEAGGAALLFLTNVAAILITGIIVMGLYGVRRQSPSAPLVARALHPRRAIATIVVMLVVIGVPLTVSTVTSSRSALLTSRVQQIAHAWAADSGWELLGVSGTGDALTVRLTGSDPAPDPTVLSERLGAADIPVAGIKVELIPSTTVELSDPAG